MSHSWLFKYQSIVSLNPCSNVTEGSHPSSLFILVASIAYRLSWPGRSFTKVINASLVPAHSELFVHQFAEQFYEVDILPLVETADIICFTCFL